MKINVDELMELLKVIETTANVAAMKSDSLFDEVGLDSLDLMNLFLDIEERFGVKIPDEDIIQLKNIDEIVAYCRNL